MAATLACGPKAVLSHQSAAALWCIRPTAKVRIDVTVPDQLRPRKGLHPHTATVPADEVTVHDGIPTTTPARTLLDLAGVVPRQTLERALDEAEVLRLSGPQALLDRYPRRRGTKNLGPSSSRPAVQPRPEPSWRTAFSPSSMTTICDGPQINTIIAGFEVDAVWREAGLIVELDGFATHGTRRAFERDRVRDRRLMTAGWRVDTPHQPAVRRACRARRGADNTARS